MVLKSESNTYTLSFKIRQMNKLCAILGDNPANALEKAAYAADFNVLADIFTALIDVDGMTKDMAYDIIDTYLDEGKTLAELYSEVFSEINKKGFFGRNLDPQNAVINMDEMLAGMISDIIPQAKSRVGEKLSEVLSAQLMNME